MEPRNDEQRSIIDQWLTALHDPDWNTRATAVRMLGELGELTPLEPLLAVLNDEDESVRAATVRALGKLGERTPVDRVVTALSDPSWMVREMAALTLGELGERAPREPLLDLLRTEHEDVFVREAAQTALQQTHPEFLPSLTERVNSTNHTQDLNPDRIDQDRSIKSSPAWLTSFAKHFSRNHTIMQKEDDLVEISNLDTTAHASPPLPPPVSVSSKRRLPVRIVEGVLAALLIVGIGFSWLVLTQKLHQPSHAGATPTPTPSPTVLPSGLGSSVGLTVVNGAVDVGTMNNAVYALRASDGSLLWRYNTAGPVDSSPLVVNGVVYVNSNVDQGLGYSTGYIYALRASDGQLLWRYTTGNFVYNGYLNGPIVANGIVFVGSQDGNLIALRANDGVVLWHYTAKGSVDPSLAVNGIVYVLDANVVGQGPEYLEALGASDGKLLWRTPSSANPPVLVNNVLYITSQAGLSALRASDGALLWRYALASTVFDEPAVLDGVVYAVATKISPETTASIPTAGYARLATAPSNGKLLFKIPFKQRGGPSSLYALRASDGAMLWHYQTPGNKNIGIGVLAIADGLLYLDIDVDPSKTVISALRASDGSIVWTRASDTLSDLVVVNQGIIYITSYSDVVSALQAQNGKELWRQTISGNTDAPAVLNGSTLYVGTDSGMIYALDASTGSLRWHYVTNTGS